MDGTEQYTWEYWKDKFKGMSEEEINKYWRRQMQFAEDSILDDEGLDSGIRAETVKKEYRNYIAAKKRHEEEQLGEEIGD